ncbi:MAG TPA: L,D-transpeptidase family protein [Ottowia sp.]|uniref:L,D-transpeptidase family protein n=1 Tax=Ottowia sp. TaxID=1898956 RepID=UPI002CE0096A|nr:L,D-transpeptidase family protein [Ottowia sp.]HMN22241.1 L,D-transpeptidase family protein [Ottowia sp.]
MTHACAPHASTHRQPGAPAHGARVHRAALRLAGRARRWVGHAALLGLLLPLAAGAQSLWFDQHGQPSPAAHEAVQWLAQAASDGLRPADYDAERWARALDGRAPVPAERVAEWDAELTQTVARYLQELRHGRVDPARLGAHYDSETAPAPELETLLRAGAASGQLAEVRRAATPPWPQYAPLREALARYRELAGHPAWDQPLPGVPGGKLQTGQRWPGLPALAERLRALGDLPAGAADAPEAYDAALQDGVRAFQARHTLDTDGVLGRATLAALAVTPAQRVQQIELALERLRMTPLPAAARFITVNVPEFMLRAWQHEGGAARERLAMRVVVGKALDTRTPLFDEDMRWIEFNPYWNIPRSITRNETLPKLRANPGYLAAQGMEFVGPGGERSSTVTPELLEAVESGAWRVRQRPGRLNALGDIKFVLPNNQAIYLHHTPSVSLFNRARRDFSHGCIRVEEPVELAHWVLDDDAEWPVARIRASMGQPRTLTARLATPVPVLIVYRTVTVQDGRVHFAPDLYGQDALLERTLAQRPQQAVRAEAPRRAS